MPDETYATAADLQGKSPEEIHQLLQEGRLDAVLSDGRKPQRGEPHDVRALRSPGLAMERRRRVLEQVNGDTESEGTASAD